MNARAAGADDGGPPPGHLWRRYEVRGIYLDLQLVSWNSEVAAALHTALHSSSDHELIVQFNQLLIIYMLLWQHILCMFWPGFKAFKIVKSSFSSIPDWRELCNYRWKDLNGM